MEEIGITYVLESLFDLSKREKEVNLSEKAEIVLRKAATKGVAASDWESEAKGLGLSQAQYYYIIRILKTSGFLYKDAGFYRASLNFAVHLNKMSTATSAYLKGVGVH